MNSNFYLIPGAIVLGGLILAGAIFLVRGNAPANPIADASAVRPVSPADHIVGSPSASVVVIEYSDIDCPYCKQFQQTMAQLMTEYGPTGNVAWVYRHFPLVTNHPNAAKHAEAAECVGSIGGEESFWLFIDALHAAAPGSAQFDPKNYPSVVSQMGVDQAAFDACLSEKRFYQKVEDDTGNALAIGARGTPYLVILIEGQEPVPVSGALPYAAMKKILDEALTKVAAPAE